MKKINFISPVHPDKKTEIRWWFLVTICAIGITCIYIATSLFSFWYHYRSLLQQKATLFSDETTYQKQISIKKEKENAWAAQAQKVSKVKVYESDPKNPLDLLQSIIRPLGQSTLYSCTISPHTVEIVYESSSPDQAQKILNIYESMPSLHAVELVSLNRHAQKIRSTVRGSLKTMSH